MSRNSKFRDPRGHSLRVYADVYDSPAWAALGPFDVLAYLALLRELKAYNNGDISLPLTRAKRCGINHHITLARSLRALCAVGLVAITRKGGCSKGGQRLPTLYRLTDRECFEVPAKHIEARAETNEWKRVTSREHGLTLIAEAEAKTKTLGHPVTHTASPNVPVEPKTRTPRDTWNNELGHGVTMAESGAKPIPARVSGGFATTPQNASHGTPRVPPMHIATPGNANRADAERPDSGGVHQRAPWGSIRAAIIRELLAGPKTSTELASALGLKASAYIRPTMEIGGAVYRVLSERTGRTCLYTLVPLEADGDSAARRPPGDTTAHGEGHG